MNLYTEFFYKVVYGVDSVSDSQSNYLQVELYANPDIYLSEYSVKDIKGNSFQEKIILHLNLYIDLDRRVKHHWRSDCLLTESVNDFFEEKKNNKKYGFIFSSKHIQNPVTDLNCMLDFILKEYDKSKDDIKHMKDYLAESYVSQKMIIDDHLKQSYTTLEKHLNEKTSLFIKDKGMIGIDEPINYDVDQKSRYDFIPLYLATPEYLSKLKLNKSLNEQFKDKENTIKIIKI